MTDKTEREEVLADKSIRSQRAKEIMNDPLVQEARLMIESTLYRMFKNTQYDESEKRDQIHKMTHASDRFMRCFQKMMEDGEIAEKELLENKGKIRRVV